ncbi:MAG: UDP-N-acetylglucosamine 2-epimerase (hydrolyzing) [Muribaculaceae bacterium]|nr:UDP-N-acetylglucosamine 2-epimerase (hydrolyzing) [Muribaculaceae bacterium]
MKIAVATTTRADWGLLSPLARELRDRGAEVQVMAANMHYNPALGMTIREIEADGFTPVLECKTQGSPAEIAAACLVDFADALERERPACIICLGDRYEMLSIAQAAVMEGVPVVHIAGGAVSEGATDDMFRHAITKLSSLHLTECEEYRHRVICMNEDPHLVINTGAIGIHNILNLSPIPSQQLNEDLGFEVDGDTLLCTMHSATLDMSMTPEEQYDTLLLGIEKAFSTHPRLKILFTYPNNDVDPTPLIAKLEAFREKHPERVLTVPSLGMKRYLSALQYAGGMIGNSSSGIVEVASLGKPVLDIGIRQQGRMRAASVIHCECDSEQIALGIDRLFTPELQELAAKRENPYARRDTLQIMTGVILSTFS